MCLLLQVALTYVGEEEKDVYVCVRERDRMCVRQSVFVCVTARGTSFPLHHTDDLLYSEKSQAVTTEL